MILDAAASGIDVDYSLSASVGGDNLRRIVPVGGDNTVIRHIPYRPVDSESLSILEIIAVVAICFVAMIEW